MRVLFLVIGFTANFRYLLLDHICFFIFISVTIRDEGQAYTRFWSLSHIAFYIVMISFIMCCHGNVALRTSRGLNLIQDESILRKKCKENPPK